MLSPASLAFPWIACAIGLLLLQRLRVLPTTRIAEQADINACRVVSHPRLFVGAPLSDRADNLASSVAVIPTKRSPTRLSDDGSSKARSLKALRPLPCALIVALGHRAGSHFRAVRSSSMRLGAGGRFDGPRVSRAMALGRWRVQCRVAVEEPVRLHLEVGVVVSQSMSRPRRAAAAGCPRDAGCRQRACQPH
jgi:hypothetical protein